MIGQILGAIVGEKIAGRNSKLTAHWLVLQFRRLRSAGLELWSWS